MRRPLHGDVVSAARALLMTSPERRCWVLTRMLWEADRAQAWVATRSRAHPVWGDGTLMCAALRRRPVREPSLENADYCGCLALVFKALAARGD